MKKVINKIFIICIIIIFLIFSFNPAIFAENDSNTIVVNLGDGEENSQINDETNNANVEGNNENNSDIENKADEENNENEIDKLVSQKSELENAISENEAQMGVVFGQLSEVLSEVEELSIKISSKEQEIKNIELEELAIIDYIEDAERELEEYSQKYEKNKSLLETRLVAMYEMGETKYLDVLLNSENLSDFLSRYYLVSEITENDYNLITRVKETKERTEAITKSLTEKKEQLEEEKQEKEKNQISLSNMEILKNNKLNNLSDEELKLHNEIEEYRNQISNIEFEIKQIALQNLGMQYIGGTMIWPTPGYTSITSPFGMRTHPITGIYKLHTGMDISAPYGSTFVAVGDGVVVKAEYNIAYGNMVIIDHGGGVTTLYAHGSEILVSVRRYYKSRRGGIKSWFNWLFNRTTCSF